MLLRSGSQAERVRLTLLKRERSLPSVRHSTFSRRSHLRDVGATLEETTITLPMLINVEEGSDDPMNRSASSCLSQIFVWE